MQDFADISKNELMENILSKQILSWGYFSLGICAH